MGKRRPVHLLDVGPAHVAPAVFEVDERRIAREHGLPHVELYVAEVLPGPARAAGPGEPYLRLVRQRRKLCAPANPSNRICFEVSEAGEVRVFAPEKLRQRSERRGEVCRVAPDGLIVVTSPVDVNAREASLKKTLEALVAFEHHLLTHCVRIRKARREHDLIAKPLLSAHHHGATVLTRPPPWLADLVALGVLEHVVVLHPVLVAERSLVGVPAFLPIALEQIGERKVVEGRARVGFKVKAVLKRLHSFVGLGRPHVSKTQVAPYPGLRGVKLSRLLQPLDSLVQAPQAIQAFADVVVHHPLLKTEVDGTLVEVQRAAPALVLVLKKTVKKKGAGIAVVVVEQHLHHLARVL